MSNFTRFENLIGKDNIDKLRNSHVLVLGIGGVGGYVVEGLVRSSIGEITIVDGDIVDFSNINRQIIALNSNVGCKKVDLFEERIKDINPDIVVNKIDKFIDTSNIELLFSKKVDFIIDAIDYMPTKIKLIEECKLRGIREIVSCGTGRKMDPSKLEITTLDKTSYDPIAKKLRKSVASRNIVVLSSNEKCIDTYGEIASCIFVPAVGGLLISNYVVKEIIKKTNH